MSVDIEDHDPTQGEWPTPADLPGPAGLPFNYRHGYSPYETFVGMTVADVINQHLHDLAPVIEEDPPNIIRSTN